MFYQQAPRLLFFMPGCTPQQRPAVFVQHNALSAELQMLVKLRRITIGLFISSKK